MSTKVKGLFKGFKHITKIFDEKEKEMQIGLPTDVKHVAHIGIDGQSANTPSWMNEFKNEKSGTEGSSGKDINDLSARMEKSLKLDANEEKKSRRKSSKKSTSPLQSPQKKSPDAAKSRLHHLRRSSDKDSQDSSSSGKARRTRRNSNNGHDSQEVTAVPKHSHRRKSKGSSKEESSKSRSSKCKDSLPNDQYHFPDFGHRQGGHVSKENEHIAMAISA